MTDLRDDIQKGDTERNNLLDMAAEHFAKMFVKLRYPMPYSAVRNIDGYVIEIKAREFRRVEVRDEDSQIEDG